MTGAGPEVASPISGYASLVAALTDARPPIIVSVQRETDWIVVRGELHLADGRSPLDVLRTARLHPSGDHFDESEWSGTPLHLTYMRAGTPHTFRWVTRGRDDDGSLRLDPPTELLLREAPAPGAGQRAILDTSQAPRGGFVMLGQKPVGDRAAAAAFDLLKGADLRGRARRGQLTNQPRQMAAILAGLMNNASLLLSVGTDHGVYAATLSRDKSSVGAAAVRVGFSGKRRPNVERGHILHLSGMVDGRMCTLRLVADRVDGSEVVCHEPEEATRYQRRASPRYRLQHPQLAISLVDERGASHEVKQLQDFGVGGLGVVLGADPGVEVGDSMEARLALSETHGITLPCRVASRATAFGPVRLGLQFVGLSANQLRIVERLIQKLGQAPARE